MTPQLLTEIGDELRRRPPARRPSVEQLHRRAARRARRRSGIAAVTIAAAGIGGLVAIAGSDRPPGVAVGPTSEPVPSVAIEEPGEIGWPPRLLIDGWEIGYYRSDSAGSDGLVGGSMTYTSVAASTGAPAPRAELELMWSADDRTAVWSDSSIDGWQPIEVAGHPALAAATRDPRDRHWIVVIDVPEGSVELRVPSAGQGELDEFVGTIRAVDTETFIAAMPASVVDPSNRGPVVAVMLYDVPLPDDFDRSSLLGNRALPPTDRTTLATAIASDVACAWLDDWFEARDQDDPADLERALAALESAPHWPLLQGITPEQNGLPEMLFELVGTLRDGGTVASGAGPIPITRENATDSLGCTWSS